MAAATITITDSNSRIKITMDNGNIYWLKKGQIKLSTKTGSDILTVWDHVSPKLLIDWNKVSGAASTSGLADTIIGYDDTILIPVS
jgi:hypothetical protein